MTLDADMLVLALAWIGYFLLHSVLASLQVKNMVAQRWPALAQYYRLLFNGIALLLLLPIGVLTLNAGGDWLWTWQGGWQWLSWAMLILALAGFLWSSRYYDMPGFLGFRRAHPSQEQPFQLSPLHRFVRHPWYFFGLLLIWSRDMNSAMLLSALLLSLYIVLGSRLEERKLVHLLGKPYQDYCQRVPRLIPLPWRTLSRQEAEHLVAEACVNRPSDPI